jgi:ATP-dependent Lon protease
MTGEISLRGLVLPVGGIKEKVLAAKHEHPVCSFAVLDRKDLQEVSPPAKEAFKFKFLETVDHTESFKAPYWVSTFSAKN